jgi:hypothetical protein
MDGDQLTLELTTPTETQAEVRSADVIDLSAWKPRHTPQVKARHARPVNPTRESSPVFFRMESGGVLCDGCDQEFDHSEIAYSRDMFSECFSRYIGRHDFCEECLQTPAIHLLGRRLRAARIKSGLPMSELSVSSPIISEAFINDIESGLDESFWDDYRLIQKVYVLLCAYNVSTWDLFHGLTELHRVRSSS